MNIDSATSALATMKHRKPKSDPRGTVRCVRCGHQQHDMPLDRLGEYACGKFSTKAGQPCGGGYVAVKNQNEKGKR